MTTEERLSEAAGSAQLLSAARIELATRYYRRHPEAYCLDVLGLSLTPDQIAFCRAIAEHNRVYGKAAHSVGKSVISAGIVNWHFDCFKPGKTISTAPTKPQVDQVLWSNIRKQRLTAGMADCLMPAASEMRTAPDHFAVGLTAANSDAYQGRHEEHLLIHIDEAVGVKSQFLIGAESMATGESNKISLTYNPTDTASQVYRDECKSTAHIVQFTVFDHENMERSHPNILAGLEGKPIPFPGAVTVGWIDDRVADADWCEEVSVMDVRPEMDFEWRGKWYRPGGLFESRVLGRWPSDSMYAVWSDARWKHALKEQPIPEEGLQIGCDVARFGDDNTSIVARRGACALHHETHNGWDLVRTANRLMELASELANDGENPKEVVIVVDDDGVGGGVTDILRAAGYTVRAVNGQSKPFAPKDYPNVRSENWFAISAMAGDGLVDVSRLPEKAKSLLRSQLLSVRYDFDGRGRRVVEQKDETKKPDRLGRSPDDADAFNLAYCKPRTFVMSFS